MVYFKMDYSPLCILNYDVRINFPRLNRNILEMDAAYMVSIHKSEGNFLF